MHEAMLCTLHEFIVLHYVVLIVIIIANILTKHVDRKLDNCYLSVISFTNLRKIIVSDRLSSYHFFAVVDIFAVKALPSAGIIPLLQMFCPNKTHNKGGFPIFPESKYVILNDTDTLVMTTVSNMLLASERVKLPTILEG